MNSHHSKVTDWGLNHISIGQQSTILDAGCGGGRTVSKLAAAATQGKVYGIDFSSESVKAATRMNRKSIAEGRVEIREESVSKLSFSDGMFDLITAVETHIWWPDLPGDMREILRVLKPGGTLVVISEVYKGATALVSRMAEKYAHVTGMSLLTVEEHRELFSNAGYSEVKIDADPRKGWICVIGKRPTAK